jgi:hypothetical protein
LFVPENDQSPELVSHPPLNSQESRKLVGHNFSTPRLGRSFLQDKITLFTFLSQPDEQVVRARAIARRTPKQKTFHVNIVQQALRTFKIMQNLQNIIRKNIGIYFPRFLCELVRVKAGSRVMILLRCTTSNGTCSYYLLSKQSNLVLEERTSQTRSGEFMAYQFYRFPGNSGDDVRQVRGIDHFLGQTKKL